MMRAAVALTRAGWLTQASYRFGLVMSLASLVVMLVPIYLVAEAIHPVLADEIAAQGDHYFAFLVVGMIGFAYLTTMVNALPMAVRSGLSTGTLEALLATPASRTGILGGLLGAPLGWTTIRALVLITAAWALGVDFVWERWLGGAVILGLLALAHLPFGIAAAALVLAFRTAGPLPRGVLVASGLLGGVYYPTEVIPSWIQTLSYFLPLTYGLRALRRAVLEGVPLGALAHDVGMLALFAVALLAASGIALAVALRYARRSGTLAQY